MATPDSTPTLLLADPAVRDHLSRAAAAAATQVDWDARAAATGALTHMAIESPLEAIFVVWWTALARAFKPVAPDVQIDIEPQCWVEVGGDRYRLDFRIVMRLPCQSLQPVACYLPIAIELDGHRFHERTPEQVAERNARDRALQMAGWRVFHFSWREMSQQPEASIRAVYTFAFEAAALVAAGLACRDGATS